MSAPAGQNVPDGIQRTLLAMTGEIDPDLRPCPKCAGQLRAEVRPEWRPLSEVLERFPDVTVADVLASAAQVNAFGQVKAGVPYVTCMHCGFDADASNEELL